MLALLLKEEQDIKHDDENLHLGISKLAKETIEKMCCADMSILHLTL